MRKLKPHNYKGVDILPSDSPNNPGERWYIPIQHKTKLFYSENHCPHYYTLAQAKRYIDLCVDHWLVPDEKE